MSAGIFLAIWAGCEFLLYYDLKEVGLPRRGLSVAAYSGA